MYVCMYLIANQQTARPIIYIIIIIIAAAAAAVSVANHTIPVSPCDYVCTVLYTGPSQLMSSSLTRHGCWQMPTFLTLLLRP